MILAHLSDIHFGRIAYPEIVDGLVEEVNTNEVDLVVVSGDLTQRARPSQYRAARAMIDAFTAPTLVVPGNHDVYAWWRPASRIVSPLRRYRKYITDDLLPTFERNGVAVLGINSAYGRTVKGGRIGSEARARIGSFFGEQPEDTFNVLVVHHHLMQIQALGSHDVARKARRTLEQAAQAGVDLILCGHLHVSHVEPVELDEWEHRLVIVSAGTATSNRGRPPHRATNFYNRIEVEADAFTIEERRYDPEAHRFVHDNTTRCPRTPPKLPDAATEKKEETT
ncbi:MAG TPA: metallophosphoesterase [Rhodothermales bacterium]|nr:metallophosphoesterase [Rhodothermales bacterium]